MQEKLHKPVFAERRNTKGALVKVIRVAKHPIAAK